MERANPSVPDPRFPNRPTHPDFALLSEAVQDADEMSERNVEFGKVMGQYADPESLTYMTIERARLFCSLSGLPEALISVVAGAMIDGFSMGVGFERRKNAAQPTE